VDTLLRKVWIYSNVTSSNSSFSFELSLTIRQRLAFSSSSLSLPELSLYVETLALLYAPLALNLVLSFFFLMLGQTLIM